MTLKCTDGKELLAWLLSWGSSVSVEYPKTVQTQLFNSHIAAAGIMASKSFKLDSKVEPI